MTADPPRLKDDPALARMFADERASIDAGTSSLGALKAQVTTSIASQALPRIDPTSLSGLKGLIAGAVVGIVAGVGVGAAATAAIVHRQPDPTPVVVLAPPPTPAPPTPTTPTPTPTTTPTPTPTTTTTTTPTTPTTPMTPATPMTPTTPTTHETKPAASTLAEELALFDRAEQARKAGRCEAAVVDLATMRKRFPDGALAAERKLSAKSCAFELAEHGKCDAARKIGADLAQVERDHVRERCPDPK